MYQEKSIVLPIISRQDHRRLDSIARALLALLPDEPTTLLDVGCGNGELAARLLCERTAWTAVGVEVVQPSACRIAVTAYDGWTLPFPDDTFDIVLCSDMLHHTSDPVAMLTEAARVSRRWVVVKDHQVDSVTDRIVATVLDWIGNVGTGVPMPFNFLSSKQWQDANRSAGLEEVERLDGLRYWFSPLSNLIDRNLHFVVKLRVHQ